MNSNIIVHKANQRHKTGILATAYTMIKRTYGSRELIWQIYKRDFINGNKRSFLGFAWNLVGPLVGALSWIIMNMTGILSPGEMDIPYPVYVLMGLSIWGLFSSYFSAAAQTLNSGRGFITQVSYPHEALMVKQAMQAFSYFIIGFVSNLAIISIMGYPPTVWVVAIPLLTLPLLFLGCGLGLVLSVLAVASDFERTIMTGFGFILYSIPVIYSVKDSGILSVINKYNPLTYLVVLPRDMILYGQSIYWSQYGAMAALSLIVFLISLYIFYVTELLVIEKMG